MPGRLHWGSLLEAQQRSPLKTARNGNGGKQSAAPLSLSLQLLHRGAGQLLAPNLYQLSKYSCPDTGCWIARGRNSVPHRQQLVKHLTPSLLWAGSLFLSYRKESRASEAGPLPAESLQAMEIPPGTN